VPNVAFSLLPVGKLYPFCDWMFGHPMTLPDANICMDMNRPRGDSDKATAIFFEYVVDRVWIEPFDAAGFLRQIKVASERRAAKAAGHLELFDV